MSDYSSQSDLIYLGKHLLPEDVQKLVNLLNIPSGLGEEITDGISLLYTLQKWGKHSPIVFYKGLQAIGRSDLLEKAEQYPWLASKYSVKELSAVKNLVKILGILSNEDWHRINIVDAKIDVFIPFGAKLKSLLQEGYIASDLTKLTRLFSTIKREDIANIVQEHQDLFSGITDLIIQNCINTLIEDIAIRNASLVRHMKRHKKKVQQMLDDEKEVDLESVFVPLMIIKEEPRSVNLEDEITYNDIAFIHKIANKEVNTTRVDFDTELKEYSPSKPEIWCLIGNPGSGKTFLRNWIGLCFGQDKLPQFSFAVSVPCRNSEWHQMEKSKKVSVGINYEFVRAWLCLSLPVDASWCSVLAEHLIDTDGEELLIIIDGIDEFTKEVPFERTLLFLLLTRGCLTASTIIITTRLGAYLSISSNFQLKIDRLYQVLGFSPENRDLYFRLQLPEEGKLDQLEGLIYLHDEINQLSLIPVNASLFAALVRRNDDVSTFSLTLLCTELISYLIRRQLSRMKFKHLAKKQLFSQMHPDVLDCLHRIGEVAYLEVFSPELTSMKDFRLKVDGVSQACQWLGLTEEHKKKRTNGEVFCVWCFSHRTIRDFVGANWLRKCSWGDQCLSTRYIANSDDNFSVFKKVLRFLCGLLADDAKLLISILFKYAPTKPLSLLHTPTGVQLNFLPFIQYTGWTEFSRRQLMFFEILLESNSISIYESSFFIRFLPQSLYFYFSNSILPNEWECFMKTLRFLHSIQLIYIELQYFSLEQFSSFINHLTIPLCHLVLNFYKQDISTLSSFSEVLRHNPLPHDTKLSLILNECEFRGIESTENISSFHIFELATNLCLEETHFAQNFLQHTVSRINSTENIFFFPNDPIEYNNLIPHLHSAMKLTALHLYNISGHEQQLRALLPKLSNLQEITLYQGDCHSLLPCISSLSQLNHLNITSTFRPTEIGLGFHLLRVMNASRLFLRDLSLSHIDCIGRVGINNFFSLLSRCNNLVYLQLSNAKLQCRDLVLFGEILRKLRSLVFFGLYGVRPGIILPLCKDSFFILISAVWNYGTAWIHVPAISSHTSFQLSRS